MATKIVKKRHLEAAKPLTDQSGQAEFLSDHDAADANDDSQQKTTIADSDELEQILKRILKLSDQADNPGVAYRNLETIHALSETLAKKLGLEIDTLSTTPEHQRPSRKIKS